MMKAERSSARGDFRAATAAFPDLPPLARPCRATLEIWTGVSRAGGHARAIVRRLNREINAVSASPELKPVLEPDGATPMAINCERLCRRWSSRICQQWKQIASDNKIVAE